MKLLWKAIADKLRSIPALATVCGHTDPNDPRIARSPTTKFHQKGLYFMEGDTFSLPEADTDQIQRSVFGFHCVAETAEVASDIQRQFQLTFANADVKLAFLDITNADVHCNQSVIDEIQPVKWHEDLDLWDSVVEVTFTWSYK